jgi:16S rRNA (uracil1498-N3)-methyltransferase
MDLEGHLTDPALDDPRIWRLPTFLTPPGALGGDAVTIDGDEGHHAVDVMRVRSGGLVRLIDGQGTEAVARIETVGRGSAGANILERRMYRRDGAVELTIYQALLKGRAFDEVVRRCSELGAAAIVPTVTERAVGSLTGRARTTRPVRWRAVSTAAAKQSRGVFLTKIEGPVSLGDAADSIREHDVRLVAWEEERGTWLPAALESLPGRRIALVVGPEGGLTGDETRALADIGAIPVTVGRRILKADWAAAAIAAMISNELGGLLP